jgi:hypothetical protein
MSTEIPPIGRDSAAAAKLQILATEHWSLLATRSLTYTESLGRVNMFLAILSGAVIALALVAQADHFGPTFISVAIFMLTVVVFVGIATVSRLMALNRDDYRWVIGMNRLRSAYLDLHPELEPHFVTSPFDDFRGALQTMGIETRLSVIVAAVIAAIGALVAFAIGLPLYGVLIAGAATFVVAEVLMGIWGSRNVRRFSPSLAARFPSPKT